MSAMSLPKKGYGLLIVDTRRPGAKEAAESLQEVLQTRGVRLVIKENLSTTDMLKETEKLSDEKEVEEHESTWLVISAHGSWKSLPSGKTDVIHGDSAADFVSVWKLTERLSRACPKGKPAIIILQSCRGYDLPQIVELEIAEGSKKVLEAEDASTYYPRNIRHEQDVSSPDRVPILANQLLLWATTPGNFSFRPPMFRELTSVLRDSSNTKDLEVLLTKVVQKVAEDFLSYHSKKDFLNERKITPVVYSMLIDDVTLA